MLEVLKYLLWSSYHISELYHKTAILQFTKKCYSNFAEQYILQNILPILQILIVPKIL